MIIDFDIYYESARPTSTDLVQVTLIQEEGPGGGNPWYAFAGEPEHLRAYLNEYNHKTCTLESEREYQELLDEQLSHVSSPELVQKLGL